MIRSGVRIHHVDTPPGLDLLRLSPSNADAESVGEWSECCVHVRDFEGLCEDDIVEAFRWESFESSLPIELSLHGGGGN